MNYRKIPIKILLLVVSMCSIAIACTNLDEEVFSQVTVDNFFQTEEELVAAIGSVYANLYGYMNNDHVYSLQETSSDELVVPTRGNGWNENGTWRRLHTHEWTPDNPRVNSCWNFCYQGVNAANRLIFQFEQIGTAAADVTIAELKVFRAMYYYWLLDLYGNVPIVTRFADAEPNPANNTRQEVYNFVISEITDNVDKLSKEVDPATYGRVDYYTGQAILAKVYMNAGVYTGTPQWEKALAAIREITGSGKYSLATSYFDNFDADNENSPEFIFAIPFDEVFAKGFVMGAMGLHFGLQDVYDLAYQPWNGWAAVGEFYDTYEENDKRRGIPSDPNIRGNFISGPQFKRNGDPVIDNAYEVENPDDPEQIFDPDGPELNLTVYPNGDGLFFLRQDGARVAKYEFEQGGQIDMNNDFPIFRLTDFVLLEAEALLRLGQETGTALMLVNQIRERAGVDPFTALTEESLLAERGRELFAEAIRRQDLIRFGVFNDAWWEKDPSPAFRNLYPIPRAQLDANSNLTQNPGY